MPELDPLLLARIQFAFTISFHILFPSFTIGLAAWLFRGPLLVLAVATLTRLPVAPFWQLARVSLVALPAAGLVVGAIARWRRI